MFQRFFTPHPRTRRYPYEELSAFLGAWKGLWWGAVGQRNPFDSLRKFATKSGQATEDQPEAEGVAWEYDGQPGKLFKDGNEVLTEFHKTNLRRRQDGTIRMLEKRFTIPNWHGFTLRGVIDRLDIKPDGVWIIDYKNGRRDAPTLETSIQMTIYQLAYSYLRARGKIPGNPPLRGLQFYNYRRNELQEAPLRRPEEFGLLLIYLMWLKSYWEGVLFEKQPPLEVFNGLMNFNLNDLITGDVTPNLPHGEHCKNCRVFRQCREWERGLRPNARAAFIELHRLSRQQLAPAQTVLPLLDRPMVAQTASGYARLMTLVLPQQLKLESILEPFV